MSHLVDKKEKENIALIENAMIDARFVLDDAKPSKGIQKTLLNWIISFSIVTIIIFLCNNFVQNNIDSPNIDMYFNAIRLLTIFLYIIPVGLYILSIFKIEMTLKEAAFLKTLIYFPILVYLIKILFPLSYYLNSEVLVSLYDIFPLDTLFLIIFLIQIFMYFRKNSYLFLIFISLLLAVCYSTLKMMIFQQQEITSIFLMKLNDFFDILNVNSIFVLLITLIVIVLIKYDAVNGK